MSLRGHGGPRCAYRPGEIKQGSTEVFFFERSNVDCNPFSSVKLTLFSVASV